ncbi:hypothetical protein [Frigoriglobus tundricola]|uniref:Uncharacterized protein n=1 Tax=Frigoriglobus tundricola TaxID=2774151 RepID=A0A6M5YVR2_9BACT|nr:hypothetical protein [Frigoriglobus tundricola]QJW98177.1 hypothetical protein FTUN_5757 [Frigoriglobus tundricola]
MTNDNLVFRVFTSLRNSCFGSDEFQAYTATYSWLSNQMAHTTMGFFLAIAIGRSGAAGNKAPEVPGAASPPAGWRKWFRPVHRLWTQHPWLRYSLPFLIPACKLPFDYIFTTLSSKNFPIDWLDFWHDKFTDLTFWYLGMLFAQVLFVRAVHPNPIEPIRVGAPTADTHNCSTGLGAVRILVRRGCEFLTRFVSCLWAIVAFLPERLFPHRRWLSVFALITAIGLGVRHYEWWTEQKGTFDRSDLPSGWVRLSHFRTDRVFSPEGLSEDEQADQNKARTRMQEQTLLFFNHTASGGPVVHCVIRGSWPVNRSALATALGAEFAVRRKAVYYFTANKLMEGPDELSRWKRFARDPHDPLAYCPFTPRAVVIDDLPKTFPAPAPDQPIPVKNEEDDPYNEKINSQRIFNWFFDNRDRVSTIWVLSCEEPKAIRWLEIIQNYACFNERDKANPQGTDKTRSERVIDIDLGPAIQSRPINRAFDQ